jgi:hypothetical protein
LILAQLRGLKPDQRTTNGLAAACYSNGEIAVRRGWTKTEMLDRTDGRSSQAGGASAQWWHGTFPHPTRRTI